MNVDYIELMQSDFSSYRVYGENILELDYSIKPISVDCSLLGEKENQNIILIESLLLVIDDYTKIINLDAEEDYNPIKRNLAQIAFYFKDGTIKSYYINMSDNDINKNQTNVLDDSKLYITIEENF